MLTEHMEEEARQNFDNSLAAIGAAPSVVSDEAREARRRIASQFEEVSDREDQ